MPLSSFAKARIFAKLSAPISGIGLFFGALAFSFALMPSLIPRGVPLQGLLAGVSLAAGYGFGLFFQAVWLRLLELPAPRGLVWRLLGWALLVLALYGAARAFWLSPEWQNDLRRLMGLEPVEETSRLLVLLIALISAGLLLLLWLAFLKLAHQMARRLTPFLSERASWLIGGGAVVLLFLFVGNDLILQRILRGLDASYLKVDQTFSEASEPPPLPFASGGPESLIAWGDLGAAGRRRVADPLDAAEIERISGAPAMEPLRVYVGLGSAETPEGRAALALQEAIRIGAFERSNLVIATPTGTGWIDPAGAFPMEVLTRGDLASVSVQYSYLPSWLALSTIPEYGVETAREVFAAFHGHWRRLPPESRPRLYLFGLSLGAYNSDLSADFYDLIGAPYDGAFWVGPPFLSRSWRQISSERAEGTPEWLPRFRDGSVARFLNQTDMPDEGRDWGPLRMVYLQYASDPITFFSPAMLWREPDWMKGERGKEVSQELHWLPLVTFLQVGFDMFTATTAPRGYGHVYAGEDYLRGWLALLSPEGWDEAALGRLREAMKARGL